MKWISSFVVLFLGALTAQAQDSGTLSPPPDPFAQEESAQDLPPLEESGQTTQPAPTSDPSSPAARPSRPRFADPFKEAPVPEETAPVENRTSEPMIPAEPAPVEIVPKKDFEFPSINSSPQGPKTQEILRAEQASEVTPEGAWSLGFLGGGAFNANRRNNQAAFEFYTDYRIQNRGDLGVHLSYRVGGDWILGFLVTYKYFFRLTSDGIWRIELAPMAGLGWHALADKVKFNQGRMPIRYGAELVAYALPRFAVITQTVFESFLFGYDTEKKFKQYFTNGGLPTQILVTAGVRFEF